MNRAKNADKYIATAPVEFKTILKELRALIIKLVPNTQERISYGMPFYDYKGRLVYFAAMKDYIGLYIPPPIITDYSKELKTYITTKSAIHLPVTKLPLGIIKKLIKARMRHNELKEKISPTKRLKKRATQR